MNSIKCSFLFHKKSTFLPLPDVDIESRRSCVTWDYDLKNKTIWCHIWCGSWVEIFPVTLHDGESELYS